MAKQGQDTRPAEGVTEAQRGALDRFRHDLSDARGELDALKQEAQATSAAVTEALGPVVPLTESARALSTAIESLEWQLQRFAQQGTPLYLGPPPARPGPGVALVLLVLCGLVGLGWVLFGPEPAARFPDLDRPAVRDPLPRRLSPAPAPADPPAVLDPVPPPAPVAPGPRRDADA